MIPLVRVFYITLIASLLASLAAAMLADAFLGDRIAIIGSFAGLRYSLNPGIAFGLRLHPVLQPFLIAVALGLVAWLAFKRGQSRLGQAAYGLILGGALGNVIDRLPDGLVTDYFQVGDFPIFNVADSCITIGAAILLLESLKRPGSSSV